MARRPSPRTRAGHAHVPLYLILRELGGQCLGHEILQWRRARRGWLDLDHDPMMATLALARGSALCLSGDYHARR